VKIDILTLFPEMLEGVLHSSILDRARKSGAVEFRMINIRDFARDRHRTVDDRPFGGGPGMVMKCEPLVEAIESLREEGSQVIYLSPEGERFDQAKAAELSASRHLIFVSGHYEGIDERVREGWIDRELSIGDYVLTNGTLPAAVIADAVVRLLPGVLGNEESSLNESFSSSGGLLEGPHYTRPDSFRGMGGPEVLKTGNHEAIRKWREEKARQRTRERRPDLLREGPEDKE